MSKNLSTPAEEELLRVLTRYLPAFIAVSHSYKLLLLLVHLKTPMIVDSGFNWMCITFILINIYLFLVSKYFQFCEWHRFPIYFSLYYEFSRLINNSGLLYWFTPLSIFGVPLWSILDGIVFLSLFSIWVYGYRKHSKIMKRYERIRRLSE